MICRCLNLTQNKWCNYAIENHNDIFVSSTCGGKANVPSLCGDELAGEEYLCQFPTVVPDPLLLRPIQVWYINRRG
jgi:hypothetical protein